MKRRRIRLLAVVSATLALGVAAGGCRGLLGIDEEAPLLPSEEADGFAGEGGVATDGGVDTSAPAADGGREAAVTAVDRRYAQWPLPPPHPLLSNYDLASSEMVTDQTTGLVWQRQASMTATYSGAASFCKQFRAGGQTDWRLPTRIELLTILDYGEDSGGLNRTVFPDDSQPGPSNLAWSASLSLLRAKLDDHLVVNVTAGATYSLVRVASGDQGPYRYRCVRGGPVISPASRYVVVDGTARDVRTNLVWQIAPFPGVLPYSQAKTQCAELDLGGFATGWRVPDIRELGSLIDEAREVIPLLPGTFPAGPTSRYWSSTLQAKLPIDNYVVDFASAGVYGGGIQSDTEKLSVRCVH